MKYINTFDKFNEALGVPDNIIETSKKVYKDLLNVLDPMLPISIVGGSDLKLRGDYRISDMKIDKISVNFTLEKYPHDEVIFQGMSSMFGNYIDSKNNFRLKTKKGNENITLGISLLIPDYADTDDIILFLDKNKNKITSIISHELKHYYDKYKKNTENIGSHIRYDLSNSVQFGSITPLNKFLYMMYYMHNAESLVRPTEIATLLDLEKVKPEEFKKYLLEDETFKVLKFIKDYTYNGLKKELYVYIDHVKYLLESIGIDVENMTDSEIIESILEQFYIYMTEFNEESLNQVLYRPIFTKKYPFQIIMPGGKHFLRKEGKKEKFIKKYLNRLKRFGDDYEKFFNYEIKSLNKEAFKVIKKLGKLYEFTYKNKHSE